MTTSITSVLADARKLGIILSRVGGKLRIDSPVGALTAELRAELVTRKAEVLDLVPSDPEPTLARESPAPVWPPVLPWRSIVAEWPIPKRKAWGERANELFEQGHRFPEDERLAFEEITNAS